MKIKMKIKGLMETIILSQVCPEIRHVNPAMLESLASKYQQ